jgi:hypothetical protein
MTKLAKHGGKSLARNSTKALLHRLTRGIALSGTSLRSLCADTMTLDPPERMFHTQLSLILRYKSNRNLYLQQYLAICMLLKDDPIMYFLEMDDLEAARGVAHCARQISQLPDVQRERVLAVVNDIRAAQPPKR